MMHLNHPLRADALGRVSLPTLPIDDWHGSRSACASLRLGFAEQEGKTGQQCLCFSMKHLFPVIVSSSCSVLSCRYEHEDYSCCETAQYCQVNQLTTILQCQRLFAGLDSDTTASCIFLDACMTNMECRKAFDKHDQQARFAD